MDLRLHVTEKRKQSVLRQVFKQLARPLETLKARNDGNCRDHSGSQMACENQTVSRCKLQIMQKGTRTTRCEYGKLPEETYGHRSINSAFCDGMATTVTAAHHFIWRPLYASMQAAQTPASKLEKAAVIEKTISVKEHERKRDDFDPTVFYENCFWNQRPDDIVILNNHRTLSCILEFNWSSDRNEDYLRVKEDDSKLEANEQHKSIIKALKAAAPEFTFEQINFVSGWRCAVVEDNFYNKLRRLNVQTGKKDKILVAHVQRICEAQDTVIRSYYQQIHGSSGADATTIMDNIGGQV